MNIAIVHWIINDVGGINSWTENFILGLKQIGHNVDTYYGTYQLKLNCDPDRKVRRSRRWHLLPARHLSYHPSVVSQSVSCLNNYDLIVFAHPSPHPTKYNLNCSDPKLWQLFYTETHSFKISVFHDRHWSRSNSWIADVRKNINYVHAAQHHFLPCVEKFSVGVVSFGWGMFPLLVPKFIPSNRVRRFVLPTQWLSIKNHKYLIPNLEKLDLPLHSYGSGQTYHTLLPEIKRSYREDHHYDNIIVYNPKVSHIHFGHVPYRQVINAMRRSWFSVDLSAQGMTNMTHWEPMTVGCVSIIERRVLDNEYCEIPRKCALEFDLDNVVEDLNRIGRLGVNRLRRVQREAFELVQSCRCDKVAGSILKRSGVI